MAAIGKRLTCTVPSGPPYWDTQAAIVAANGYLLTPSFGTPNVPIWEHASAVVTANAKVLTVSSGMLPAWEVLVPTGPTLDPTTPGATLTNFGHMVVVGTGVWVMGLEHVGSVYTWWIYVFAFDGTYQGRFASPYQSYGDCHMTASSVGVWFTNGFNIPSLADTSGADTSVRAGSIASNSAQWAAFIGGQMWMACYNVSEPDAGIHVVNLDGSLAVRLDGYNWQTPLDYGTDVLVVEIRPGDVPLYQLHKFAYDGTDLGVAFIAPSYPGVPDYGWLGVFQVGSTVWIFVNNSAGPGGYTVRAQASDFSYISSTATPAHWTYADICVVGSQVWQSGSVTYPVWVPRIKRWNPDGTVADTDIT
jgi:hypothetical protein